MLELLVGCGGGDEKAFAVAGGALLLLSRWGESGRSYSKRSETYPAVNRPTIRVPAIVAWQMGIMS